MKTPPGACSRRVSRVAAGLVLVLCGALPLLAAQLRLELKLIWATDDEKYAKHERVDPATTEKLRKIFKWKHYFVINTVRGVVPNRGTNSFKMSDKCTIEIAEQPGTRIEVKLIGEGKPVVKATKDLAPGEWVTIGGDDKDGTGWFVLIKQLDDKAGR
jgi:hypothetical protein